jgi:hypothetical protein
MLPAAGADGTSEAGAAAGVRSDGVRLRRCGGIIASRERRAQAQAGPVRHGASARCRRAARSGSRWRGGASSGLPYHHHAAPPTCSSALSISWRSSHERSRESPQRHPRRPSLLRAGAPSRPASTSSLHAPLRACLASSPRLARNELHAGACRGRVGAARCPRRSLLCRGRRAHRGSACTARLLRQRCYECDWQCRAGAGMGECTGREAEAGSLSALVGPRLAVCTAADVTRPSSCRPPLYQAAMAAR